MILDFFYLSTTVNSILDIRTFPSLLLLLCGGTIGMAKGLAMATFNKVPFAFYYKVPSFAMRRCSEHKVLCKGNELTPDTVCI